MYKRKKMTEIIVSTIKIDELKVLIEAAVYQAVKNRNDIVEDSIEEILSVSQAARFLSLSPSTIYSLVSRKILPVSKKGKRLYFSKQDLSKWILSGRRATINELKLQATARLIDINKGGKA